jgi:cobalamin biosynthesis Co2+ chelatase CbiK
VNKKVLTVASLFCGAGGLDIGLEKAGFKVDAYIHGIGENKAIRDLYVKRAEDAWNALEK